VPAVGRRGRDPVSEARRKATRQARRHAPAAWNIARHNIAHHGSRALLFLISAIHSSFASGTRHHTPLPTCHGWPHLAGLIHLATHCLFFNVVPLTCWRGVPALPGYDVRGIYTRAFARPLPCGSCRFSRAFPAPSRIARCWRGALLSLRHFHFPVATLRKLATRNTEHQFIATTVEYLPTGMHG